MWFFQYFLLSALLTQRTNAILANLLSHYRRCEIFFVSLNVMYSTIHVYLCWIFISQRVLTNYCKWHIDFRSYSTMGSYISQKIISKPFCAHLVDIRRWNNEGIGGNISPMISLFQRRISTKCAQNGFDIIFCEIYEPIVL